MTMTVDGRDAPVHGDLRTVLAPAPNCMADARNNPRRPNDMQGKKKAPSNVRNYLLSHQKNCRAFDADSML